MSYTQTAFTKKQFALYLVEQFCKTEKIKVPDNLKSLSGYIGLDSNLAVALEYLGVLSGEDLAYAQSRGGTVLSRFDQNALTSSILSARDLLQLLPN